MKMISNVCKKNQVWHKLHKECKSGFDTLSSPNGTLNVDFPVKIS